MTKKRMTGLLAGSLGLLLLVAACGGQPTSTPTASRGGPVIDYTSLVDNLRAAGLTVVEPLFGAIQQPFLSVTGKSLTVNGDDVQVFEYPDATSADADASHVSPDGSSVANIQIDWVGTPHFYQVGRLLVIYVGNNTAVVRALEAALGPQFAGR